MGRRCCCPTDVDFATGCDWCIDDRLPEWMYVRLHGVGDEPLRPEDGAEVYPHTGDNADWNDVWWELKLIPMLERSPGVCRYGATTEDPCRGFHIDFDPNWTQPFPVGCGTNYPYSDPYTNMFMHFQFGPLYGAGFGQWGYGSLTIGACAYLDMDHLQPTWYASLGPIDAEGRVDCMNINAHWINAPSLHNDAWTCASWRSWVTDIEIRSPPDPDL